MVGVGAMVWIAEDIGIKPSTSRQMEVPLMSSCREFTGWLLFSIASGLEFIRLRYGHYIWHINLMNIHFDLIAKIKGPRFTVLSLDGTGCRLRSVPPAKSWLGEQIQQIVCSLASCIPTLLI